MLRLARRVFTVVTPPPPSVTLGRGFLPLPLCGACPIVGYCGFFCNKHYLRKKKKSDGQSCFPAGLRGPVFLGFSLALINSGVPPLPPCPFGPCPTPPLPREPGPCILGPFPPPATLGVPPEAGLWNLRVCHSSLRLCGALRTLDSGFCASNSGALCWRPSGLRTVDSGWVAEGMARSPDSGFWNV